MQLKITEIVRSFSQTRQYKQYEPVQVFASYKGELTGDETLDEVREISELLYQQAKSDVVRSLAATLNQLKNNDPPF